MTADEKQKILEAWEYCDTEDKSTEYLLQYMSDVSGVSYDDVVDYVISLRAEADREEYYEMKQQSNH